MPALGLPDAVQKISADASGYLEALDKIIRANEEGSRSIRKMMDDTRSISRQLDEFERNLPDLKINMMVDEHFHDAIGGIRDNIMKMAGDALKANADMEASFGKQAEQMLHLKTVIDKVGTQVEDFSSSADRMGTSVDRVTTSVSDLHAVGRKIQDENSVGSIANDLYNVHQAAGNAADSIASVHREGSRLISVLGGGAGLMAALAGGLGGGAVLHPNAAGFGMGLGALAATGVAARMGSGGGFGGVGTALAAAAGGFGGGMANLGSAIAGASGGGPTAADTSRVVTGFIRRWYGPAHWAVMLTNELLATVGPALAAGGMGALTAAQGFEQLVPRGKSVFNTAESLGGSLGMTTGQFWGLKTSYLQNAQDMATGLAPQLAGAAVNILGSPGTSGVFTQLGLNTDAMFARFMASLTTRFQKGGLGGQLGGLVGGGTGYLQQFGDVLANLGNTFLNTAPNLPGVGGDLLSILSGGTHALAATTGWLGPALGPLLAGEAGLRWGPAIVGTAGRGIAGLGNILGNAGRGGLLSRIGLGTGLEGGLAGVGAALGGLSAPEIAGIAAGAFYLNKAYTYQPAYQVATNQALAGIGQMGFVPGYQASIAEMQRLTGTPPGGNLMAVSSLGNIGGGLHALYSGVNAWSPGQAWGGAVRIGHGLLQMGRQIMGGGPQFDMTPYEVSQQAIQKLAGTMVNALNAGGQIQQQWQKLSGQAIDMGKATDVATMAQLQLGTAFQKNGMLSPQAQQMIANLYAGYAPMHMNQGMFGAAVGAQTTMAGLQHTQVAAVNQAYDQLGQLVTGGAQGASTFFGLLGGTPTTFRRGGVQFAQAPAMSAMAHALGSFTTPAGAAAWNRLVNPQTGLFPALQGQTDWLRQAQVMGALNPAQTTGMASYMMAQLLPALKGSPAGLAMLSTYAQQFGGPGFAPGTSASAMFRGLSGFFGRTGVSAGGYNRLMTLGTEGLANIGTDANKFVQNIGQGIGGAMSTAVFTRGEDLMKAFMTVAGHRGTAGALGNLVNFMAGTGTPLVGAQAMIKSAANIAGASPASINAMMGQVKHQYDVYMKVHADTAAISRVASQIQMIHGKAVVISAHDQASTAAHQAANSINAVIGKHVRIDASTNAPAAAARAKAAMESVPNVTRTITIQTRILGLPGFASLGAAQQAAGAVGKMIALGHQTGGMVPGSGHGDIVPAMLEPGEAIVPRYLVPLIAPILAAHNVPGFGSVPKGMSSHFAAGGVAGVPPPGIQWALSHIAPHTPVDISGNLGKNFTYKLIDEITKALNATDAKKIATALVSKIGQEIQYAKGIASNIKQGLNLGGMDLTQGGVLGQMQNYAVAAQAFGTDLTKLRKGHLNKDLIAQIIGAGPVQGDALAQSILGGPGGIGAVNALYKQIGHSANIIGAQGAMAQFGGFLAPNLKSGSFTSNNVSINISAGNGATLALTDAQIKQLVAKIQAALLKQAKRNPKTGIQLAGKGA